MMKLALVFAASFAVAAGLASLPGCLETGGPNMGCYCPPRSERPAPQGPLETLTVTTYDEQGNYAVGPVTPVSGSLEVTSDSVVIRYEQDSAQYLVEYDIW